MGNNLSREHEKEDQAWKTRNLYERHFEELAVVLPRMPSYLGLVALKLKEDRVEQIIKVCEAAYSNETARIENHTNLTVLTKYMMLYDWKMTAKVTTAEALHQNLSQAGYEHEKYETAIRKEWPETPIQENASGNRDFAKVIDVPNSLFTTIGTKLGHLNVPAAPEPLTGDSTDRETGRGQSEHFSQVAAFTGLTAPSSYRPRYKMLYRYETKASEKLDFKYVEVADVGTQTTINSCA